MKSILEEIKTKLNSNLQAEDDIPPTSEIRKLVSIQGKKISKIEKTRKKLLFFNFNFKYQQLQA